MRISDWSSDVCSSDLVTVLTNQTPFYGESGGQMGDAGTIATLEGAKATVSDTGKPLGRLHTHQAKLEAGTLQVGDTVQLSVDAARRDRTEERRVGKEWVSTCRSRWWPIH